ncbi:hypothetical protein DENSPDRAFT_531820 [Dentipellis sp. KUC8613]|nr:hypothetical protein DENSPDRAFT_531820 [Dentipellis sp. KUC8613]
MAHPQQLTPTYPYTHARTGNTPVFPWTEPIFLRFTTPDPAETTLVPARPPSGSLFFNTSNCGTGDSVSGSRPESVMPPQSAVPSRLGSTAHVERAPGADSLYTISTRRERRGRVPFLRKEHCSTIVSRTEGKKAVATISWDSQSSRGNAVTSDAHEGTEVRLGSEERPGWRLRRRRRPERLANIQDSQGKRYTWRRKDIDEQGGTWRYTLTSDAENVERAEDKANKTREENIANLTFDADDEPGDTRRRETHHLDRSVLEIRLREHADARIQEMQDLCVTSIILILLTDRDRIRKR